MVAHLAPRLFDVRGPARYGGRAADLLVDTHLAGILTVEVKATGERGLAELTDHDVTCDVLVWLDFASRYGDGMGDPFVYVLPDPARCRHLKGKTTLRRFVEEMWESPELASHIYQIKSDRLSRHQ